MLENGFSVVQPINYSPEQKSNTFLWHILIILLHSERSNAEPLLTGRLKPLLRARLKPLC